MKYLLFSAYFLRMSSIFSSPTLEAPSLDGFKTHEPLFPNAYWYEWLWTWLWVLVCFYFSIWYTSSFLVFLFVNAINLEISRAFRIRRCVNWTKSILFLAFWRRALSFMLGIQQHHSCTFQDLPRPWTASGFIALLTHALLTPYFDVATKADVFVAVETIVSHEHLRASTRASIAAKTLEVLKR